MPTDTECWHRCPMPPGRRTDSSRNIIASTGTHTHTHTHARGTGTSIPQFPSHTKNNSTGSKIYRAPERGDHQEGTRKTHPDAGMAETTKARATNTKLDSRESLKLRCFCTQRNTQHREDTDNSRAKHWKTVFLTRISIQKEHTCRQMSRLYCT